MPPEGTKLYRFRTYKDHSQATSDSPQQSIYPYESGGGLSVVAESYSANSWYRKYSDGWIEQGGRVSIPESSSTNVTFLVPFKNTNYTVSSADTENLDALEYTNSVSFGKSTTGLVIKHHNYAAHYDWRAAGF